MGLAGEALVLVIAPGIFGNSWVEFRLQGQGRMLGDPAIDVCHPIEIPGDSMLGSGVGEESKVRLRELGEAGEVQGVVKVASLMDRMRRSRVRSCFHAKVLPLSNLSGNLIDCKT